MPKPCQLCDSRDKGFETEACALRAKDRDSKQEALRRVSRLCYLFEVS